MASIGTFNKEIASGFRPKRALGWGRTAGPFFKSNIHSHACHFRAAYFSSRYSYAPALGSEEAGPEGAGMTRVRRLLGVAEEGDEAADPNAWSAEYSPRYPHPSFLAFPALRPPVLPRAMRAPRTNEHTKIKLPEKIFSCTCGSFFSLEPARHLLTLSLPPSITQNVSITNHHLVILLSP